MNQASAADAISPTMKISGRLRLIAGCATMPWICFSGLAKRSVAIGAAGVSSLLIVYYTGMLMMSLYADNNLFLTCNVASKLTEASCRASITLAMSIVSPRS